MQSVRLAVKTQLDNSINEQSVLQYTDTVGGRQDSVPQAVKNTTAEPMKLSLERVTTATQVTWKTSITMIYKQMKP